MKIQSKNKTEYGYADKNPLISVIIPCHNGEKFVEQAVRSVMEQTYSNLEIICCNDCSTDGTPEILNTLAKEDSRIKILNNEANLKLPKTLNKMIDEAKGEFIARMDADDICLPERIEKQLSFMIDNPQIDFCGCNAFHINENGKIIGKSALPESFDDVKFFLPYFSTFYHPTILARANIFKENHYDEEFLQAQDYELWCRLIFNKGLKGENLEERLFMYRVNSQGISKQNTKKQTERAAKIFDSGNYVPDVKLHKNVFYLHDEAISKDDFFNLKNIFSALRKRKFKYSYRVCLKILFHLKFYHQYKYFLYFASRPLGIHTLAVKFLGIKKL